MPVPDITIALNDHNYNKNEKVDKSVMLPASPLPVKPSIIGSVKECVGHYAKNDLRTKHVVGWSGKEELHDRIFKRKTYEFAFAGEEVSIESSTYANKETFSQELCHALNPNEVRYITSVEPMSVGKILKRPIRPSLTVIASQEDEEGFAALRKYGTGVTSDRELINQASTTAFAVDKDADERRYSRNKTARTRMLKNLHALNARESSVHIPSLVLKEKEDVQRKVPRKGTQSYGWVEKIKSLMGHEKQTDPTPTIEANLTEQFTPRSIASGNEGIVRQKRGTRVIKIDLLEKLVNISHIKQVKTLNRNKKDEGLVRQCCNVADQIITEEWMEVTHTGKENTVEEYVPTEEEIKEEMEVREFGECMLPKTIRSAERLRGKNKIECDLCEDHVMLALDCLLEKIRGKESGESSPHVFKKCSCRKKRKRKMKSSDMEYIPSFYRKNNVPGDLRIRKSDRLKGNQSELVGRICEVDQQDLNDSTFRPELNKAPPSEACPQSKKDSKEDGFVSKPPRSDINHNYLKNVPEFDPSEQIVTKPKYSQKITKFLRQQKKKSNRPSNRKYSGFELKTVSGGSSVEIAGSQTEKVIEARKAQISKEEADIIDDLLHDLKSEFIEKPPNVSVLPNFYGMGDAFCGDTINEFEEFLTMGGITVFTPNFDELVDI